jgi:divalent metal cation (Fe/Co/Zn/Cd) transporter
VTLATWRISRRTPTDAFPWGYGKFETFGTLSVSVILVGGAIGIGLHSYHVSGTTAPLPRDQHLTDAQLLLQTLLPFLETYPPDSILATIGRTLPHGVPSPLLELFHSHGPSAHDHSHAHDVQEAVGHAHAAVEAGSGAILNPHAAWFALASVAVKEWLYRLTARVATQENSPVLKANALQ